MIKKLSGKSIRRERFFRYAPLVLWTGVIFYLSTGNASMSETSRFVRPLLEFLFPNAPAETLVAYHGYVRKLAHFTEYGVLAFFALQVFANSSVDFLREKQFVAAFGLITAIAVIDETNQSFNHTRTGSVYDVLLDCSGGLSVLLLIYFWKRFVRKANLT